MKLLVIGHARHGKDTFCEMLRDRYGMRFETSSLIACREFLFDLSVEHGLGFVSPEDLYKRRGEVRPWMHDEIRDFNEGDLTRLARLVTKDNDIYCGVRNREELEACKAAGVFDAVVWVDRSEHLLPEPMESMQLRKGDPDVVIDNNGSLKDLQDQADFLMVMLRLGQLEAGISERAAEKTDLGGITDVVVRYTERQKVQAAH
jgi:hypothetical protein